MGPAKAFRDVKGREEYRISGLCQSCQDDVFTPSEAAAASFAEP